MHNGRISHKGGGRRGNHSCALPLDTIAQESRHSTPLSEVVPLQSVASAKRKVTLGMHIRPWQAFYTNRCILSSCFSRNHHALAPVLIQHRLSLYYAHPDTRHRGRKFLSFLAPDYADPIGLPRIIDASSAGATSSRLDHEFNVPILPLSDAQRNTIYALSTPMGKAGVAVIRISGQDALKVWRSMVDLKGKGKARDVDPEPWKMYKCGVVHPDSGEILDDGLAVYFKGNQSISDDVIETKQAVNERMNFVLAPRSFTTEDVVELHVHSGRAIISSILAALSRLPFCRPAEPGEFTRRAFEGGRLDLTQVEGLRDLIDAETESQRRLALKMSGVCASYVYCMQRDNDIYLCKIGCE